MSIYYIDGKFVQSDMAVIPVNDLSIVRGIGVFDLLRTYNGKPYKIKEHIERLRTSAEQVGILLPWSHEEIASIVKQTIRKNNIKNASVRIIVTGGSSYDFMTSDGYPRLLVLVNPAAKIPDWWYSKGIKIITCKAKRSIPIAKSIDYIPASLAMKKATKLKCSEALYVTNSGLALECTTANIFAFIKNKLVSPGRFILSGITRKTVIQIAKKNFDVEIRDLKKSELLIAEEVFITGTHKGVVPVIQIDNTTIGNGKPGHKTLLISKIFNYKTKDI